MATPSRFIARWKPSISVSFFIAFKKSTGEGAISIKEWAQAAAWTAALILADNRSYKTICFVRAFFVPEKIFSIFFKFLQQITPCRTDMVRKEG